MKRLTVALIAALSSPLVVAAEKPYLGIDYQMGTLEFENNNLEAEPQSVRLRVGTEIKPYLAVEMHAALGTSADTITFSNVAYDVKVESLYGVFLRPQISLNDVASAYALVGGSYADKSIESTNPIASSASTSGFEHSVAAGVGVDFKIYTNLRLNVDYMQYNSTYSTVSAGLKLSL